MALSRSKLSHLIFGLCILFGFLVVGGVNLEWSQNRYFPFYHLQASAFLHGEANLPIPSDSYHDVIPFKGKKYLALPPLNAMFVLPFVAVGMDNVSERLVFFVFYIAYAFLFRAWSDAKNPTSPHSMNSFG